MSDPTFSFVRKFQFFLVLSALFLLFVFFVGEIGTRVLLDEKKMDDKFNYDSKLGWIPKSDYTVSGHFQDSKGNRYLTTYSTSKYGFRTWGDVKTTQPKVLFIGDSYTQAIEVGNDSCFYNRLKDSMNIEVFAFGASGYGQYQESMIIDKVIDEIQPDLIVLQTCDNDFLDNNVALEKTSNYKVNRRRPYLDVNGVEYYSQAQSKMILFLENSHFIRLLIRKLQYGIMNKVTIPAEKRIAEDAENFNEYQASLIATDHAVKAIVKAAKGVKIVSFTASSFNPQMKDMNKILENNNIPYTNQTSLSIDSVKQNQIVTSSDQYHWVDAGHRIIATELTPLIKAHLNRN